MKDIRIDCPNGHGKMVSKKAEKKIQFRGVDISVSVEDYSCPVCRLEAGTIEQAAHMQKAISETYREAVNLLTGREIVEARKKLHLSQDALAKRMNVGIASIKRWEGIQIQSKSMDRALRLALTGQSSGDTCTGNRTFSLPRIKLVLNEFESVLGKKLLKKNDKMLFASKYLWYADMVAHRELGESMTGSTYAALPFGPQLNNYRDLIEDIMGATESSAVPLTKEEKKIIARVAMNFPKEQMVYDAAHREKIWKEKANGAIIPYSDSSELNQT